MKMRFPLIALGLLVFVFVSQTYAGSGHKHHFGIFAGVTNNIDAELSDFSVGVDYEYFINLASQKVGIGFIGDVVFADHTEYIAMGGIFYHPSSSFKIIIGNGIAAAEHEVHAIYTENGDGYNSLAKLNTVNAESSESEWVTHYVLRLGAAYDFHIGNFSISPTFNYDLIDGHGYAIYGLTFGIGF